MGAFLIYAALLVLGGVLIASRRSTPTNRREEARRDEVLSLRKRGLL